MYHNDEAETGQLIRSSWVHVVCSQLEQHQRDPTDAAHANVRRSRVRHSAQATARHSLLSFSSTTAVSTHHRDSQERSKVTVRCKADPTLTRFDDF
eukprot:3916574-Pleurochrysis_carterae.AAC.1